MIQTIDNVTEIGDVFTIQVKGLPKEMNQFEKANYGFFFAFMHIKKQVLEYKIKKTKGKENFTIEDFSLDSQMSVFEDFYFENLSPKPTPESENNDVHP